MTGCSRRSVLTGAAVAFAAAALARKPASAATEHVVEISRFRFEPARLRVRPGDTVTWINRDIAPHTASAMDGSWGTGELRKGEMLSLTAKAGWASEYFCRFHPMMKAAIEVDQSG